MSNYLAQTFMAQIRADNKCKKCGKGKITEPKFVRLCAKCWEPYYWENYYDPKKHGCEKCGKKERLVCNLCGECYKVEEGGWEEDEDGLFEEYERQFYGYG